MLYDLEAVKAGIRNADGKRVFYLGKGDQLTSQARDHLNRERIPVLPARQAKPERWRLLGGGYMEEKPEHMTHLHGDILVPKTHPRIAFRGAVDTLESEILLCRLLVPEFHRELGELLDLARMLIRCEVMNEPLEERLLCQMDRETLRQRSHRPQDFYGQPHFMPEAEDGAAVVYLNRVRCAVRETERKAAAALPERPDIIRGLNSMSSAVYILMIQAKKNRSVSGRTGE